MYQRQVKRFNRIDVPGVVSFECLALPNTGFDPEVEIVYEEGTMGTNLAESSILVAIMEYLGLNEDSMGAGCNGFYLTVSLEKPQFPTVPVEV